MKSLYFKRFITALFATVISIVSPVSIVMAGEVTTEVQTDVVAETETDVDAWLSNGTVTQSFYMPKSLFQSSYEYQKYCEQMYSYGYMDNGYNWTDSATEFINNPTVENYNAVTEEAKKILKERVESGEIDESDNIYNELERAQNEYNAEHGIDSETEAATGASIDSSNETSNSTTGTMQQIESETEAKEVKQTSPVMDAIGKVIMVLFMAFAALGAYYIYKRQF